MLVGWFQPFGAVAAFVIGLACLVGWFVHSVSLTSMSSNWVSMKFGTAVAVCFLSVGHHAREHGGRAPAALAGMLAATFAVAALFGVLPSFEDASAVMSVGPDVPSWGTVTVLVWLSAELAAAKPLAGRYVAGIVALTALVGYMVDAPSLYYWWPGLSTAMALPTAVALLLLACCPKAD